MFSCKGTHWFVLYPADGAGILLMRIRRLGELYLSFLSNRRWNKIQADTLQVPLLPGGIYDSSTRIKRDRSLIIYFSSLPAGLYAQVKMLLWSRVKTKGKVHAGCCCWVEPYLEIVLSLYKPQQNGIFFIFFPSKSMSNQISSALKLQKLAGKQ